MRMTRRSMLAATAALPLSATMATRARAATHSVTIRDFAFDPPTLAVAAGDTVTFTNAGGAPHTATSMQEGLFDTGRLRGGESASITVGFTGTAEYFCQIHPRMRATLTAS